MGDEPNFEEILVGPERSEDHLASKKLTEYLKQKEVFERQGGSVLERRSEAERALRRLVAAGNGGGLVAGMTLFGAAFGRSESAPRELVVVVLLFLIGLVLSGFSQLCKTKSLSAANASTDAISTAIVLREEPGLARHLEAAEAARSRAASWGVKESYLAIGSAVLLILGILSAVPVLYALSNWVLVSRFF